MAALPVENLLGVPELAARGVSPKIECKHFEHAKGTAHCEHRTVLPLRLNLDIDRTSVDTILSEYFEPLHQTIQRPNFKR